VDAPRKTRQTRFEGTELACNADMAVAEVREFCGVASAGRSLLRLAMTQLGMSARLYYRILKLVRMIADLEDGKDFAGHHMAETIQHSTTTALAEIGWSVDTRRAYQRASSV